MSEARKFYFFTGKLKAGEDALANPLAELPEPPKWRQFGRKPEDHELDAADIRPWQWTQREQDLAEAYQIGEQPEILSAVNAALILRRPLLVTGPAGSGKSSLIYAISRELRLGPVLTWSITSRSSLREGQYDYEALGRLQDIQAREKAQAGTLGKETPPVKVEDYVRLGPLGTAFAASQWPRALLIDEIDKADLDLPNDLLNLFEEGKFTIEELRRDNASGTATVRTWKDLYGTAGITGGQVACAVFPFILLTSNGEREFSAPFLRRCVRLHIGAPKTVDDLARIVKAHMKDTVVDVDTEAAAFLDKKAKNELSTDQLMNAIFVLQHCGLDDDDKADAKRLLLEALYKPLS
jgi:MoxR-like ATPase